MPARVQVLPLGGFVAAKIAREASSAILARHFCAVT